MCHKKIFFVISIFFIVWTTVSSVNAFDVNGVPVISETEVPRNLNLVINKNYAKHSYLKQISANQMGEYALFFRNDKAEGDVKPFNYVYIQLFNSKCDFVQEISFFSKEDLTIQLTDETLNIYFCKIILVYKFDNQTFSAYSTEDWAALDSGIISELRKSTFTIGEWTYKYKRGYMGYTGVSRSNDLEEQVLFKTDKETIDFYSVVLPGVSIGAVICIAGYVIITRRKTNQGTNTGDGSVC